jgi:hypothetical protein
MAKVVEVESPYLTVAELQKYLGVGTRNVQQRWRETRQIPFFIIAGKILYRKSDIDKFVERHRITPLRSTKIEAI